jgi:hypothetical protein
MGDHMEIERRGTAMVEAERPVRTPGPRRSVREPVDDPDLDELERAAAAVEVAVDQLEQLLAPVRAALGLATR